MQLSPFPKTIGFTVRISILNQWSSANSHKQQRFSEHNLPRQESEKKFNFFYYSIRIRLMGKKAIY